MDRDCNHFLNIFSQARIFLSQKGVRGEPEKERFQSIWKKESTSNSGSGWRVEVLGVRVYYAARSRRLSSRALLQSQRRMWSHVLQRGTFRKLR